MIGKYFHRIWQKKVIEVNDFSSIRVDMHSHLLPGLDDGAPDLATSFQLLQTMQGIGFSKIITTPHIMQGHYGNTKEKIKQKEQELLNYLFQRNLKIDLEASAEYYFDEYFAELVRRKELLPIAGKYLLFEFPMFSLPPQWKECVFEIQLQGLIPVLAHPERYLYMMHQKELYHEWFERGIYFQMNLLSPTGYYGKPVKILAEYLIQQHLVHFVGTDCHHFQHLRLLRENISHRALQKLLQNSDLLNATL